ncbi:MAG: hypothetical protein NVS4B5_02130 [Vulcanimicrobiaceae bacterium]
MRGIGRRDVDDVDEIAEGVDIRDDDEAARTREVARAGIGIAGGDEPGAIERA